MKRGLRGVRLVISDAHERLKQAIEPFLLAERARLEEEAWRSGVWLTDSPKAGTQGRRIGLRSREPGANPELVTAYRVQKMLKLALCVAYGALTRTESRGAHFRQDFPRRDDAQWLKRTLARWPGEGDSLPTLGYEALDVMAMELPPGWRGYGAKDYIDHPDTARRTADVAALQTLGTLFTHGQHVAYQIGMSTLGVAGLLLCYTLYKATLVPRWLAVWGLVGYAIILVGMVSELMGSGLGLVSSLPGGLWEVFMGVWLIVKGFNASAFAAEPATTVINPGKVSLSAA